MIPVNDLLLGEHEMRLVSECLRQGNISSSGKWVEEFEQKWAGYCGRRYGIAVNSGTSALQLAVAALELEKGSEVLIPSFTIISCALAVLYNDLVPVLVDADPETWGMDVTKIEEKITEKTRAIMPVHIYGHPVNMRPILDLARRKGLMIIEDAAEAHGAEYREGDVWKKCGSFGNVSCFSFYANKLVTTGEGGMVLTDDPALNEKMRDMRNLCFGKKNKFQHEKKGFNFRMTSLQAALGTAQMDSLEKRIQSKRRLAQEYNGHLQNISALQLPADKEWARNVYWMYGIVLDEKLTLGADTLMEKMKIKGIETRPFFWGMHEQPVFAQQPFSGGHYPVTEKISRRGLYLPSGTLLTDGQIKQISETLVELIK